MPLYMNTPTNTAEYIFIFFDEEIHLFCTSAGLQYSILIYELLFSDEVVSPRGYFPFLYQDPTLERREAQSLRGDKWSLLGNCGVSCPERKLFYQQMPEIGQWTLTV